MCFLHIDGYHLISSQRVYCLVTSYWDVIIIRHKLSCNRGKVRHKTAWGGMLHFLSMSHTRHGRTVPLTVRTTPVRYHYHGSTAYLVLIYISTRNMHAMSISNVMHVYLHAVSVFAWMMSLLSHLLSHF